MEITLNIDTRIIAGKQLIIFLKSLPFVKIKEEKKPNKQTMQAINEATNKKTNKYKSSKDLFNKLNKKINV